MRRLALWLLLLAALAVALAAAASAATRSQQAGRAQRLVQMGQLERSGGVPPLEARSWYVVNPRTHEVLAAHEARVPQAIASITKLMTVLVALRHLKPEQVVTVSGSAANVGESSIQLERGDRLTVRDLVLAALIQSANDAADALADAAADGDRALFVGWMNDEARALGLTGTHFARPDGLDSPGHVSTARDVTLLAQVAMRNPLVRRAVGTRTASIQGGRTLDTWDDLLGVFPGLHGVKTGHTDEAGWCQVAVVSRPGITLYATVLGDPTRERRNEDLAALLRFALARYRLVGVLEPQVVLARVPTDYGRAPLELTVPRALAASVRVDRPLVERLVLPTRISLPVRAGQRVGAIRLYSNGRLRGVRPLVALRTVPRPGLAGRAGWYAGRTLRTLVGWL